MENCPICDYVAVLTPGDDDGPLHVSCTKCGEFNITDDAVTYYTRNKQKDWPSKISFWIRNNQSGKIFIDIRMLRDLPDRIILPNPFEQINKFIFWLGNSLGDNYSQEIELNFIILPSILGCKTSEDVHFVFKHLDEEGYIHKTGSRSAGLSLKGWARYDELNKPTNKSNKAFMAMEYNNPDLENVYYSHIVKAVQETGFEIDLLKDVLKAGSIDDQLRVQIRRAKFLIADLTNKNEGAYWEAGYADGLGKHVIYFCKKSIFDDPKTKPHFDTNHLTTVTWEIDTIIDDMKNLKAIIRNTFPTEAILEDKA